MKKVNFMFLLLLCLIGSCQKDYDNSNLTERLDGLEERILALEELCQAMNTNISSLQTMVSALQENDYITHIAPINNEGKTIGYTITFVKNGSITIFHGQDGSQGIDGEAGKDGHTPQIGVKKDTDGIYYWTLDGIWLTDNEGYKIKAQGENGKDNIIPQLRITEGYWEFSYDNGTSWERLGKATGEDGKDGEDGTPGQGGKDAIAPQLRITEGYWEISYNDGISWERLGKATGENGKDGVDGKDGENGVDGKPGESIFKEISEDEGNVYFTLTDNTVITIPKVQKLNLIFEKTSDIACFPEKSITIHYIIQGGDEETTVECIGEGNWRGEIKSIDAKNGYITVIAPEPILTGKILVIASNGKGQTMTKMLSFMEGILKSASDYYQVDATAQHLTVQVTTNLNYTVYIPEDARNWISLVPMTRSKLREEECIFSIEAQTENACRQADIFFLYEGDVVQKITIAQDIYLHNDIIRFADLEVKKFFIEKTECDLNKDGEISYQEATTLKNGNLRDFPRTARSFDEFQYCTGITRVSGADVATGANGIFSGNQNLESIILPESVTAIEGRAFAGCSNLKSIHIPNGITSIEEYMFENCVNLTSIELPDNLIEIQSFVFYGCKSLTAVSIPEQVTTIGTGAFLGCNALERVELPQGIERISDGTFRNCSRLKEISLPESVQYIGGNTFEGCESLTSINIPRNTTYLGNCLFEGCTNLQEIVFEEGIKEFSRSGQSLFRDCDQLESVTFPSTLTSFSFSMFYECSAITSITFLSPEPPKLTSDIIGYVDWRTTKIYVPKASLELYKTADGWSLVADTMIRAIEE